MAFLPRQREIRREMFNKKHLLKIFITIFVSGCSLNNGNRDLELAKSSYYDPESCTNHKYDDIYKEVMGEYLTGRDGFDDPGDFYKTISKRINIVSERKAIPSDTIDNLKTMPPSCRIDYTYKNKGNQYAIIYLKEDGDLQVYFSMYKNDYIRGKKISEFQERISKNPDVLYCERNAPHYEVPNYSYDTSGLSGFINRNNVMRENGNIVGQCIDQRRAEKNLSHSPIYPYGIQ
ncbi:hypothetical protein [Gluconobacter albidus]|nr:hypothetical protein [Gluconobacter albidus]MBS1029735.1 hypothetical protein [Gluconobacter albidus]